MQYIMGIDEGTTGTKSCLFDTKGNLIASAYQEYPSFYPKPGYVEQEVPMITEAIFATCKKAVEKSGVDPQDIAAVSLSSQGSAYILVGEDGRPSRPRMIGWQDLRNLEVHDIVRERISNEEHYAIEGSTIGAFNTASSSIWVQENEPEIWAKTVRIATNQDYFLHELGSDDYVIDLTSAHRISMLDVNKGEWDDRLIAVYGMQDKALPTVCKEPGAIIGTIKEDISEKTGLPVGCKICLGAQDLNCAPLGVGATTGDVCSMVLGTFGGAYIAVDEPVRDPKMNIIVKPNHGMGNWHLEGFGHTAASAFRWFRDSMCHLEIAAANLIDDDPYNFMTALAAQSKPGSNGVTALTCLQGSHGRKNNGNARGTFLGMSLATTKADLAHAVLEGICYEMYDVLLMEEEFAGAPVKSIRLTGGVVKSPFWCQMIADVTNRPVEIAAVDENGALGAMLYAAVGLGLYEDCISASKQCVQIKKTFTPDPVAVEEYKKAYELWNQAFEALNGTFYPSEE